MSREYLFFPATRGEGGIEPLLFDKDGKPGMVLWCNGRGIDFEDSLMVGRDEFSDSCRKYFSEGYACFGEDAPTYVYALSQEYLDKEAGGILQGYLPHDLMAEYYRGNCDLDEVRFQLIPAEVYAELPGEERRQYGRFAEMDWASKGFICAILAQILFSLSPKNGLILAYYSF